MEEKKQIPYKEFVPSLEYISLLLKGISGTGKTTIASKFPKPCLFNFDRNTSSIRKIPEAERADLKIIDPYKDINGNDVPPLKVWDNFIHLLTLVAADDGIKTLIIDSLTMMAATLEDSIIGDTNPKEQFKIQDWGTFGRYLKWLGDNLIQVKGKDKHIIIIAHEVAEVSKDGDFLGWTLALGGQMKRNFEMYFSDVWQCSITPQGEYVINTRPNKYVSAKCSLDLPKTPFKFEEQKENIFKQLA